MDAIDLSLAETLAEYLSAVLIMPADGERLIARARGAPRADGLWEGWIEFVREDGTVVVSTTRETTQPNRTDLVYWAGGLTPIYLEGALRRALDERLREVVARYDSYEESPLVGDDEDAAYFSSDAVPSSAIERR